MSSALLLVNSGSSSLKLSLCSSVDDSVHAVAHIEWSGPEAVLELSHADGKIKRSAKSRSSSAAMKEILPELLKYLPAGCRLLAAGHRVVHGGDIPGSRLITPELLDELNQLAHLAPLHNPAGLAAIHTALEALPQIPHVAVFDTAFHRSLLPEAAQYAVPQKWTKDWGIKRYGFHGLSYAYCTPRAAQMLARPLAALKLVICHLGHGCSAAAVKAGRSLDTTMGFTPLEGLMMATRSGNIDAAAVLHAQQNYNLSAAEASAVLNEQSGLLGVTGESADMRQILARAAEGCEQSQLAVSMFCYRVQQAVAALMVPLGGADALVFTGGIGENSAVIRDRICSGLAFLGCAIDAQKNIAAPGDSDISAAGSMLRTLVVAAREDMAMIMEIKSVLS